LLITGGCGFIGTNLIKYLLSNGAGSIRVLDNEIIGKRKYIAGLDAEFIHGDVCDRDKVHTALEGIDAVVHLAADTRVIDSIDNPLYNFQTNVIGIFNLLMCMRETGTKRLVNASTGGAIIGEATPPVHEKMVANPISPYGASKMAAEAYCSAFASSYDLCINSLRFSNVYGPHSFHKGSVVAHFFKNIISGKKLVVYGDGSQTRDYVFVQDLCEGIRQALKIRRVGVYQLGTGKPVSINKLIELIRHSVGDSYDIDVNYKNFRLGEIRHTWCDISKSQNELGYNPKTSIEEGLKKTWEWFLNKNQ
jgi:UDP-glucose 4-epimerase